MYKSIMLGLYVSWYIFCFQGAAATGSCEGYHNSGPTSTSANHHDIGPFQCSPNQHPSTLLGELAFFQLVITRVLLLQEEREVFSRVKESMASESSSKTLAHYKNFGCIDPMLCSWTFRPHFLSPALFILIGLVGELLSSTSTRYAESTAAPSPHPSPLHSTQ